MSLRITKKAWFGPKRVVGWGWSPVTRAGWFVTVGFLALTVASVITWPGTGALIAVGVLVGLLMVIVLLTGDAPGSPQS